MENTNQNIKGKTWLKRLGITGILFFTIKGCITLGLMIWAGKCALN